MTITVIVFFITVITVTNETDFRQAGKYLPTKTHIQNTRQLTGGKILKCRLKRAMTDTHAFICPTPLSHAEGKEKQKSKRKNQRKVKDKEKL